MVEVIPVSSMISAWKKDPKVYRIRFGVELPGNEINTEIEKRYYNYEVEFAEPQNKRRGKNLEAHAHAYVCGVFNKITEMWKKALETEEYPSAYPRIFVDGNLMPYMEVFHDDLVNAFNNGKRFLEEVKEYTVIKK